MCSLLPQCLSGDAAETIDRINFYCKHAQNSFAGGEMPHWNTYTMSYNLPFTTKTTPEICDSPGAVVKTIFTHKSKPGVEGIHQFWKENGLTCESLTVTGSKEVIKQCYAGKFEGRFLKEICTPDPRQISSSYIPQLIGAVTGAASLFKAFQAARNGHKLHALAWGALGITAFVLPNLDF